MIVKVRFESDGQALISDEKLEVMMLVPIALVAKRFRAGERVAFFEASMTADGVLEIGERVGDRPW